MRNKTGLPNEARMLENLGAIRIPVLPYRRGIYLLLQSDEVVYVGMTTDVLRRVGQHVSSKEFDDIMFFPVAEPVLQYYELSLIRIFQPRLNNDRDKSRPYDETDLMNARRIIPAMNKSIMKSRFAVGKFGPRNAGIFAGKSDVNRQK